MRRSWASRRWADAGSRLGFLKEAEEDGLGGVDGQRAILIREAFDTGEDAVSMEQIVEVAERTWRRDPDFAMNVLKVRRRERPGGSAGPRSGASCSSRRCGEWAIPKSTLNGWP